MDKYELVKKLKALQGLTDDEKAALIGLLRSHKKYGLVWEDKPEAVETELEEKLPTLTEVKERAIINDTADEHHPNHILIEGDNLHALTALSYTHSEKIDVIYIDPPYNTGNKDFVYNDSFVDSEDSYRHSKWLSFMAKRLHIAKKLLSYEGTIFISIDENELYQLKILCDEIFGERNFLGQWNWFKTATPPALALKVKRNVEYVIAYENHRSPIKYRGIQKTSPSNDPITKPQNTLKTLIFPPGSLNVQLKDGIIPKGTYGTAKFPNVLLNDMEVFHGTNKNEVSFQNRFIWKQETLKQEINSKTTFVLSKKLVISYKRQEYSPEVPPNLIDDTVEVNTTEEAGKYLVSIVGENSFTYPKPVSLIRYLLSFRPVVTILDFFAGSGTTMEATMNLNNLDGGHRQCILVTNNENNICEEVTYERNKRVINGYTTPKGEQVEGLHKNNLRYYRMDFVGRNRTVKNMRALVEAATDMLCIKENLYQEEPKFGPWNRLPKQVARRFTDGNRQMLVIYKEDNIEEIVDAIYDMELKEKIKVYVFSPDRDPYEDEFADVEDKVELCALPAAIYDAYMRVLPRQKDKRIAVAPETDENREEVWTLDEEEQA